MNTIWVNPLGVICRYIVIKTNGGGVAVSAVTALSIYIRIYIGFYPLPPSLLPLPHPPLILPFPLLPYPPPFYHSFCFSSSSFSHSSSTPNPPSTPPTLPLPPLSPPPPLQLYLPTFYLISASDYIMFIKPFSCMITFDIDCR